MDETPALEANIGAASPRLFCPSPVLVGAQAPLVAAGLADAARKVEGLPQGFLHEAHAYSTVAAVPSHGSAYYNPEPGWAIEKSHLLNKNIGAPEAPNREIAGPGIVATDPREGECLSPARTLAAPALDESASAARVQGPHFCDG